MKKLLKELEEQATELLDGGDSREKAQGYGMMTVIGAMRRKLNAEDKKKKKDYFKIVHSGYQKDLQREEIQIHGGENANILLIKTEEGFIIDIYDIGGNNINTMAVWEEDINPLTDDEDNELIDPNNFSLVEQEDFLDEWGQLTDEVCAELGYDEKDSDDLLMEDYFYYEPKKYWIPKSASLYTPREQSIADFLKSLTIEELKHMINEDNMDFGDLD